jgi:hypothetical protein
VQPEVIVIGGPLDKQDKRSSKAYLPSESRTILLLLAPPLDALLNRIEETKAELEQTPNYNKSFGATDPIKITD